jgi:hypothetical protein
MNVYRVWIVGRKEETVSIGEFETSFEARRTMARHYGVEVFNVVAQRIWTPEQEQEEG